MQMERHWFSTRIFLCCAKVRNEYTVSIFAVGEVLSKSEYASGAVCFPPLAN